MERVKVLAIKTSDHSFPNNNTSIFSDKDKNMVLKF